VSRRETLKGLDKVR